MKLINEFVDQILPKVKLELEKAVKQHNSERFIALFELDPVSFGHIRLNTLPIDPLKNICRDFQLVCVENDIKLACYLLSMQHDDATLYAKDILFSKLKDEQQSDLLMSYFYWAIGLKEQSVMGYQKAYLKHVGNETVIDDRYVASIQALCTLGKNHPAYKTALPDIIQHLFRYQLQSSISAAHRYMVARLLNNEIISGTQFSHLSNFTGDVPLPCTIQPTVGSGHWPLNATTVQALLHGDARFAMPNIIATAVKMGIGRIEMRHITDAHSPAYAAHINFNATDAINRFQYRKVHYTIDVFYTLDDISHLLFKVCYLFSHPTSLDEQLYRTFCIRGESGVIDAIMDKQFTEINSVLPAIVAFHSFTFCSQHLQMTFFSCNTQFSDELKQKIIFKFMQTQLIKTFISQAMIQNTFSSPLIVIRKLLAIYATVIGIDLQAALSEFQDEERWIEVVTTATSKSDIGQKIEERPHLFRFFAGATVLPSSAGSKILECI